jgi:hypothetical protein
VLIASTTRAAPNASANEAILRLLGKGSFHPAIARTFPLEYERVVLSVEDE